jgi:Tfp pilus assembly protein PilF
VKDERLHNALLDSLRLSESGQYQEALRLLDDLISEATREGDELTALVLIEHASILNGDKPDCSFAKQQFEQFLTHRPESPRVLYELADGAMKEGQLEAAKLYAKRCHQAILRSNNKK